MFIELGSSIAFPAPEERNVWVRAGTSRSFGAQELFSDTGYKHLAALRPGDVLRTLETRHCYVNVKSLSK